MVLTCKVQYCRYNNEGMCGAAFVGITQNGVCEYLVNRDGSPRNPTDWISETKEKNFNIEYPEWVENEERGL